MYWAKCLISLFHFNSEFFLRPNRRTEAWPDSFNVSQMACLMPSQRSELTLHWASGGTCEGFPLWSRASHFCGVGIGPLGLLACSVFHCGQAPSRTQNAVLSLPPTTDGDNRWAQEKLVSEGKWSLYLTGPVEMSVSYPARKLAF